MIKILNNCCFPNSQSSNTSHEIHTITRKLRKNKPHLDLSTINSESKNEQFLNEILQEVQLNSYESILENERFTELNKDINFKQKIKEIEDNLIENIQKWNKHPTEFIHCLIANHTYCFTKQDYTEIDRAKKNNERLTEISGFSYKTKQKKIKDELNEQDDKQCDKVWQELLDNNWIIYEILKLNGYKSIIYINEHSKHVVLAYQGIKFNLNDYFTTKEEKYLKSTAKLVQDQYTALYAHIKKCSQLINKDLKGYSLSFTGYSFGAVLADISVYICQACFDLKDVKSVTFESVGSLQYLKHLPHEEINLNNLDLNTYLLNEPNLVNSCNEHVGKQFFLKSDETSSNDFILKILKKHTNKQLHSFHVNGFKSLCSLNLVEMLECLRNKTEIQEIIAWPMIIVPPKTIDYKLKETAKLNSAIFTIPSEYPAEVLATFNLNTLFQIFQLINKIDLNNSIYSIKTESDVANRAISIEETLDTTIKEIDLYKRAFKPGVFKNDLYLSLIKEIDYLMIEKSFSEKFIYKLLMNLNDKFTIQNGYIQTADREIEITVIDKIFERIETLFPSLKRTIQNCIDFNKHYIRDINKYFNRYEPEINESNLSFLKNLKTSQKAFDDDFKESQYKTITGAYKSLLAFQYGKSIFQYNTCLIWIDADESREQTLNNFGYFADTLINKKLTRNNELISFLKEILNFKFRRSSFVIILNNVTDINYIKDFLVGFNSNVQFVITTDHEIEYKDYHFLSLYSHRLSHSLLLFQTINQTPIFRAHLTDTNEKHIENFFNDLSLSQSRVKNLVKTLKIFKSWDFKQIRQYCVSILDLIEQECDSYYDFAICLSFLESNFLSFELLQLIFDFLNRKNPKYVKFMQCFNYLKKLSIIVKDVYFMINDEFAADLYTLNNVEYELATEKINVILLALLHLTPDKKTEIKEEVSLQFPILIKQFDHLKKYHCFNQSIYNEFLKLEIKVNNIKSNTLVNIYPREFELKFEQNRSNKIKLRTHRFTNDKIELIFKLNFLEKLLNKDFDAILNDTMEMKRISQLFCEVQILEYKIKHELDENNDDEDNLHPDIASFKETNEKTIEEIDRFLTEFEFQGEAKKKGYLRDIRNLKELIEYLFKHWDSNESFPLVLKNENKYYLKINNARRLMNEIYVEHFKPLFKDSYKLITDNLFNKIAPFEGFVFLDLKKHLSKGTLPHDIPSNMDSILFLECEKLRTNTKLLYVVLLSYIKNDNTTRNYIIGINSIGYSIEFCEISREGFIESMKLVDNNLLIEYSDQYCNYYINDYMAQREIIPAFNKMFKRPNLFLKGSTQNYMFYLDLQNELKIKSFAQVERFQLDVNLEQIIHLIVTEYEGYNIDQIDVIGDYKPGEANDCRCYVKASHELSTVLLAYSLYDSSLINKFEYHHLILRNFKFDSHRNIIIYDEIMNKIQIFNTNLQLIKESEILDGYGCFKNFFIDLLDSITFYEYI